MDDTKITDMQFGTLILKIGMIDNVKTTDWVITNPTGGELFLRHSVHAHTSLYKMLSYRRETALQGTL